jgi:hypothetical protein
MSKFLKYFSFLLGEKNFKDLGVGQDIIEFTKIPMPESLGKKKSTKNKASLGILTIFNGKS